MPFFPRLSPLVFVPQGLFGDSFRDEKCGGLGVGLSERTLPTVSRRGATFRDMCSRLVSLVCRDVLPTLMVSSLPIKGGFFGVISVVWLVGFMGSTPVPIVFGACFPTAVGWAGLGVVSGLKDVGVIFSENRGLEIGQSFCPPFSVLCSIFPLFVVGMVANHHVFPPR